MSVWTDITAEFLHDYPRGRRLLVLTGADAGRSRRAADDLASALTAAGQTVDRRDLGDADVDTLRTDVIVPFRESADEGTALEEGTVLLVSGPASLIAEGTRGVWNHIVWQLSGDEPPHSIASALVDVTDPEAPTRRFADYCALPASYGA